MGTDLPVNAMIRGSGTNGIIKTYAPGMFSLVSFTQLLDAVFASTPALKSAFYPLSTTRFKIRFLFV